MQSRYDAAAAARTVAELAPRVSEDLALRTYTARLIGSEPALVLHGGGNTSVKSTATTLAGEAVEVLHVKGSGWDLATIEPPGHPAVRLAPLRALRPLDTMTDEAMVNELRTNLLDASAPTPSVEALLHALVPAKFVDHTHADAILALADQPDARRVFSAIFGRGLVWVPYVMPGFALAKRCAEAYERTAAEAEPVVMVLEKHGLFTWGDSARASYERTIDAVSRAERHALERRATNPPAPVRTAPMPAFAADGVRTQGAVVASGSAGPQGAVVASGSVGPQGAVVASVAARSQEATATSPARPALGVATIVLPRLRGVLAKLAGESPERGPILRLRSTDPLLSLLARGDAAQVVARGCMTPDHVLRTKPTALLVSQPAYDQPDVLSAQLERAVTDYARDYDAYFESMCRTKGVTKKKLDPWPRVVLFPGLGACSVGSTAREADMALDIYEHTAAVMQTAMDLGSYEPCSRVDLFDVEYWSLEQAKLKPVTPLPLSRTVAVVTGAASGIGLATAMRFAAAGAHVALLDRDSDALAESVRTAAKGRVDRVMGIAADVLRELSIDEAFDAVVTAWGGVDVVVSNAGAAPEGLLDTKAGEARLRASLEINTLSHASVARAASQVFTAQGRGGCLLFNASKSAFNPGPGFGPYAVAKGALVALMRQYAIDLGGRGIRSNAVNADRIRTQLFSGGVAESRAAARGVSVDAYFRANLLGREVTAEDVADAFVYLATARSTTGCVVTVDGGNAAAFPR